MLMTEEGKLKRLPSDAKVSVRSIPRQTGVCFSFGEINSRSEPGSTDKNGMENRNITEMNRNKRSGLSLAMSPITADINKGNPQAHKLKRRDLDFFRDRCKKIVVLCSFLLKRNPSQTVFLTLNSVESVLNGRPVRLTEKTFKLIDIALKSIKPETNDIGKRFETEIFGTEGLKIDEILRSASETHDCEQTLMKFEEVTSSSHKTATEDSKDTPGRIKSFGTITSVPANSSGIQHKESVIETKTGTEITDNGMSGCDTNCSKS
jgi:hypothetical protein